MSTTRDDTRTIRAKVTGQVLTLDETLQDTFPPLLALLDAAAGRQSLPAPRPARSAASARSTALKRVLLRESQVQPVLLVCEDLHWIDTETQALLDSLVESLPDGPRAAPGQLPSRVPARLGQQDLLHATAARSAAAGER